MPVGTFSSQNNSVGHIVVRPAELGTILWPWSAKNSALISSDLPRENSATKAIETALRPKRP